MAAGRAAQAEAAAEGAARGAALERAYVHDVYEGARAREHAPPDARARAFLAGLEPGSLVCDVGCGSGQYLSVNPSVFSLGGDRCSRLATQAHQDDNEVVVCDNLALPFRDDTFDAVVSVAVVHHFATVERRARALRELARVTRIGGRLLLTVWAMEHEGRDFHSQDVLIPWHAPESPPAAAPAPPARAPRLARQPDLLRPRAFLSVDNDRCGEEWRWRTRGGGGDCSPGSSSLSSPNETCYSFVRRALQRLAGRRSFLHSWSFSRSTLHVGRLERDDTRDARDLPIELRSADIEPTTITVEYADAGYPAHKSRSLTDIAELEPRCVSRSRSSLPGLASRAESPTGERAPDAPPAPPEPRAKPRLVKQKKSINEDDADEALDEATDMRSLVSEMPDFKIPARRLERRPGVFKQSSLNEELMSTERMREKERLRKNIQKQASLNEEYLFRRPGTLDSLRDSIFSTSATTAKRFQSLKNGLTNKLKTSTTGMDKVTVIGFVKMFQGWRGAEWAAQSEPPPTPDAQPRRDVPAAAGSGDCGRERRHSREDGSDSSKDSSLQSDTSVDSEDSFASVIFVPRADGSSQDPASPTPLSPGPTSPRLKVSSLPTSPRMKSAPALPSPRLKQFPIVRPPLSPKATQAPVQLNRILLAQYGLRSHSAEARSQPDSPPKCEPSEVSPPAVSAVTESVEDRAAIPPIREEEEKLSPEISNEELMAEINRDIEEIRKLTAETERLKPRVLQDVKPYPKITLQTVAELPEIPQWRARPEDASDLDTSRALAADRKRKERIRQVREMLKQGMPSNHNRSFPLVRRGGVEGPPARPPRLASLELFNPETDDADSDSSGASSPDSVGSVISVVPDELRRATLEKDTPDPSSQKKEPEVVEPPLDQTTSNSTQNLLEAAEVPQSIEETGEATVQSSPRGRRRRLDKLDSGDAAAAVAGASSSSSGSNLSLNKLSPCELRLLEERSRSHTSSSGSSSSLERLSPGRRSKERSPKLASTSNSTWSLNRLSPAGRPDAASLEALSHRSPTRFPSDSLSVSSTDSEKSISKSDSFNRLQANERLVTCKSDIPGKDEEREWNDECRQHLTEFAEKLSEKLLHEIDQYSKRLNEEDFDLPSSSSSEASVSLRLKREEEARNTQKVLDDLSDSLQQLDDPYINKISFEIQDLTKLSHEIHERNRQLSHVTDSAEDITKLFPKCGVIAKAKKKRSDVDPILAKYRDAKKIAKASEEDIILNNLTILHDSDTIVEETSEVEADESASNSNGNPSITVDSGAFELSQSLDTGCSIESEMSVDSFCTDKRSSLRVGHSTDSSELDKMEISPESATSRSSAAPLRSHFSIESSDTSASDWSRREHTAAARGGTPLQSSLSDASADSACSEGDGAGVLHRYYHVFREGELDHLIDKYVENLHIVSSYYDHSSWCVVAEKVQVWTI